VEFSILFTPGGEAPTPRYLNSQKPLVGVLGGTASEEELTSRGIRTLLFAGANTDQCVGGSLQDAFTKGWDCLLLSDGCATSSPEFAEQCIEFNCEEGWGFVLSCEDLAKGVDSMQATPGTGV
jgi:nicotinamidase-related amidase